MKKILVIVVVSLTLLLSACTTDYNEEYYRELFELQGIELDIEVTYYEITQLNDYERIAIFVYVEYHEDIRFKPITIYAHCVLDVCDYNVTLDEYLDYK
jgi:hypothetical protein